MKRTDKEGFVEEFRERLKEFPLSSSPTFPGWT